MSVTNEEKHIKKQNWSEWRLLTPEKLSKGTGLFNFFNLQDKADEQQRY